MNTLKEAAQLMGQKGGRMVLKKYGREHFSKMSRGYNKKLKTLESQLSVAKTKKLLKVENVKRGVPIIH